jgi:hypothetical protein
MSKKPSWAPPAYGSEPSLKSDAPTIKIKSSTRKSETNTGNRRSLKSDMFSKAMENQRRKTQERTTKGTRKSSSKITRVKATPATDGKGIRVEATVILKARPKKSKSKKRKQRRNKSKKGKKTKNKSKK